MANLESPRHAFNPAPCTTVCVRVSRKLAADDRGYSQIRQTYELIKVLLRWEPTMPAAHFSDPHLSPLISGYCFLLRSLQTLAQLLRQFGHVRFLDDVQMSSGNFLHFDSALR